jgi:hypothetical protein
MRILGSRFGALEGVVDLAGYLTEPETIEDRTHLNAPALGLGFTEHGDGIVGVIHVYAEAGNGMHAFEGQLPCRLSRGMSRPEVRDLLGPPESSGEAVTLPVLGDKPSWDRFVVADGVYLHVSHRCDGRPGLSLVTLMTKEFAPGA